MLFHLLRASPIGPGYSLIPFHGPATILLALRRNLKDHAGNIQRGLFFNLQIISGRSLNYLFD